MADFGLNLPTLDGLSASASSALDAVQNFSLPTMSKLKAEAVSCLKDTGLLGSFSKVTPDLNVAQVGNMLGVTSSSTSALVTAASFVPVLSNPQGGLPSNATNPGREDPTNKFKVTLTDDTAGSHVIFTVMPHISESRTAQYDSFTPLHHPGQILKYKGTDSRSWSVQAQLISRTPLEASINLSYINIIRAWTMPYYGTGTDSSSPELLGAPPPILTLTAYGDKMIGPVKCVLKSYNWDFPNDVDYIQTFDANPQPFPVILSVTLSLEESWSPAEYSGFDINEYRAGNMQGAFTSIQSGAASPPTTQSPAAAGADTTQANQAPHGGRGGATAAEMAVADSLNSVKRGFASGTNYPGAQNIGTH